MSAAVSATKRSLPTRTVCPSSTASTPLVATSCASCAERRASPRAAAARCTAEASTWEEYCSAEAAKPSTSSALKPGCGRTSTRAGCPCVRVPVLSKAADPALDICSSTAPPLTMMPLRAERLIPPRKATGAAISSGQGVARTSTSAKRTGSPLSAQASPAISRETTVKGTAKRSASRTTGALESAASATRATMRWYWLSAVAAVARSSTARVPFTDPLITGSPACRETGRDSPVREDSSKSAPADTSSPSTGTTSAGRTRSRSPGTTSEAGMSSAPRWVFPPRNRWACWGARSSRASSSLRARPAA